MVTLIVHVVFRAFVEKTTLSRGYQSIYPTPLPRQIPTGPWAVQEEWVLGVWADLLVSQATGLARGVVQVATGTREVTHLSASLVHTVSQLALGPWAWPAAPAGTLEQQPEAEHPWRCQTFRRWAYQATKEEEVKDPTPWLAWASICWLAQ